MGDSFVWREFQVAQSGRRIRYTRNYRISSTLLVGRFGLVFKQTGYLKIPRSSRRFPLI